MPIVDHRLKGILRLLQFFAAGFDIAKQLLNSQAQTAFSLVNASPQAGRCSLMLGPDVVEIFSLISGERRRNLTPRSSLAVLLRANPVDDARSRERHDTHTDHEPVAVNFHKTANLLGKLAEFVGLQIVTMFAFHV